MDVAGHGVWALDGWSVHQVVALLVIIYTDWFVVACVIGIVLVVWWYFYAKNMALHPIKVFLQNKAKPLDAFTGDLKL